MKKIPPRRRKLTRLTPPFFFFFFCFLVNEDLVADWRITTIECMSHVSAGAHMSRIMAQKMYDFFAPILADVGQQGQREQGQRELLAKMTDMCHEAYELRMMMRRSRVRYACEFPPKTAKPCFQDEYEGLVESISVEGGKNKEDSGEIAYSLFGGLFKDTETGRKVLERAQVIMKRQ